MLEIGRKMTTESNQAKGQRRGRGCAYFWTQPPLPKSLGSNVFTLPAEGYSYSQISDFCQNR